jgi:hypothetical protein
VINIRDRDVGETAVIGLTEQENCRDDPGQSRRERLKTDHLNSEEKKSLHVLYFDYQDVFLAGRQIKLPNAVRHTIHLEPGVTPINTRPYPLPETQKEEADQQVNRPLKDGIIAKSDSQWNNPILVVPKKVGPDGKRKRRLVVVFHKVNEKTVGDAYPYLISPKYWTSCVSLNITHA